MLVLGVDNLVTYGIMSFNTVDTLMLYGNYLITEYILNLIFVDRTTVNANKGIWLYYISLGNVNYINLVCNFWFNRFLTSGNKRSDVNLTLGGYVICFLCY
jgi:hypothetical protein